jgi:type I restriction enzyme R subunit
MKSGANEAFSRVLIDKALEFSGWNLLDSHQVRFELNTATGRADYLLCGQRGPLCVLEAKREDVDPYDAKEQARGYAENVKAPFIILSNGREHWFWNFTRKDQDAYRIERLPSLADLERLRLKNLQPPRPLGSEIIKSDYLKRFISDFIVRRYQIEAMDTIARQFDEKTIRKFLLEMATGTGKTILCAALIRRFLVTRNAERVLFIVDRIELAKQTLEEFNIVLAEYKPVLFKTARRRPGELLGSSVVVATLQSLMVDRRYREEFTPFHFDLVVNDEAHRSIYGDAREVVQFFQATRIGLTATPRAYLKNVNVEELQKENPKALEIRLLRDTYNYFGCKPGFPTFRYDIIDAVKDPEGPFLCLPKIIDLRSDITTKALDESGWAVVVNEQEENFKIRDLERKIFTPARNRVMCEAFLKEAQRDPAGNIGKSIVFAVNQTHATQLTKIFNELQPNIAVTITSRIEDASSIAKEFRDGKRTERIAVSVDILSTGYNCRDLLNIGLMRPIFSPTEYIQIKGRGTRLFKFKLGNTDYDKKNFFMLDFCAVAEYFEEKYDYTIPLKIPRPRKETEPPPPYPPREDGGHIITDTGKLLFSRATLKIYDRPTLRAVVQGIQEMDLAANEGHDFKGDMYEYLLSRLAASGTNGQFRTPRHIIDLIVELVNPQPGQRICDPALGTAGFLISSFMHILRQNTKTADLKRGKSTQSLKRLLEKLMAELDFSISPKMRFLPLISQSRRWRNSDELSHCSMKQTSYESCVPKPTAAVIQPTRNWTN